MNILVLCYSQSGQLQEIVKNFVSVLQNVNIEWVNYCPITPYPFPWPGDSFFEVMPETVAEIEIPMQPLSLKNDKYDLVIFGYQPWFLSPSLPASSILKTSELRKVLKDTPVLTIIGSRNMWINSQRSVIGLIKHAGGIPIGNIPFIDRNNNIISVVTILHWMTSGKKERFMGIFPNPGVSNADIAGSTQFGEVLNDCIRTASLNNFQSKAIALNKFYIGTDILFIENRAKRLFRIWSTVILTRGNSPLKRKFWTKCFKYYLFIAFFLVAPVVFLMYYFLVFPFTHKSVKNQKDYLCANKF